MNQNLSTFFLSFKTYEGVGNSKKAAKQVAAELALRSFVQFPDASEAHQVPKFFK